MIMLPSQFKLLNGEPTYALPEGRWPPADVLWQHRLPPCPRLHGGQPREWEHAGRKYSIKWGFANESDRKCYIDALTLLPCRINNQSHIYYALNDPYMESVCSLADHLLSLREGASRANLAGFLLSFVQSIRYLKDQPARTGDLPAFCSECLARPGGDCEDTSIVLASMLTRFGIDAAFLYMDGHTAVGVEGPFEGVSVRSSAGHRYYYAETAIENGYARIGEASEVHRNAYMQVWPILFQDLGLPSPVRVVTVNMDYDLGELKVAVVSRLEAGSPLTLAVHARHVHESVDRPAGANFIGAADCTPPPKTGHLAMMRMSVDLERVSFRDICFDVTAWSDGYLVGRWPGALQPRARI